jgi:hypothetical protein
MAVSGEFREHDCGRLKLKRVPATAIIISAYLTQLTSCSLPTQHKCTVVTVSEQHISTHMVNVYMMLNLISLLL